MTKPEKPIIAFTTQMGNVPDGGEQTIFPMLTALK